MQDAFSLGLAVTIVSMLGTLLALGVIAATLPLLQRFLPDEPEPGETPR
jgi:hypothetical protein